MADENSNEQYRLFIAIPVPEAIRTQIMRVQRELQRLLPPEAVRWTKADQFHLTLRFLGNVPSNCLSVLQESVHAVCTGSSRLFLEARGVGFFPDARSPRVVWVGIRERQNRLLPLQKKIAEAVRSFSGESSEDRFAGHVTLGRFRQLKHLNVNAIKGGAEKMKNRLFGQWAAEQIQIVRSELSGTGPRHRVMATILLSTQICP